MGGSVKLDMKRRLHQPPNRPKKLDSHPGIPRSVIRFNWHDYTKALASSFCFNNFLA